MGVLVSIFALQAQSACTFFDGFKDNKDGTVTDPRNGLVWKRCAEGFARTGSACTGNSGNTSWADAMLTAKNSRFLGKSDWRIPTQKEFESILGSIDECLLNDDSEAYAVSEMIAHSVDSKNLPGRFWSSTSFSGLDDNFLYANFSNGAIDYELYSAESPYVNRRTYSVRLVRATQSSGNVSMSEFKREYIKAVKYKAEMVAKEKQERQEQANREAQERRDQAARDEQYRRDAPARQARQMCEAQKQTCLATCGNPTYWNRRSYVDNQSWSMCYTRGNQISCN